MHALVFRADGGEVEAILACYAKTLGYRRLELAGDRVSWLHSRLTGRYPSSTWALRNWRVYSVCPGKDGHTTVIMRHPRSCAGSYSDEVAAISRCTNSGVYHVWQESGEVFGREKYGGGKLEKRIETFAGGPAALIDGKSTRSAEDLQAALTTFATVSREKLYPNAVSIARPLHQAQATHDLIFATEDVAERLDSGEPLDDVSLTERLLTGAVRLILAAVAFPLGLAFAVGFVCVFLVCSPLLGFWLLCSKLWTGRST